MWDRVNGMECYTIDGWAWMGEDMVRRILQVASRLSKMDKNQLGDAADYFVSVIKWNPKFNRIRWRLSLNVLKW